MAKGLHYLEWIHSVRRHGEGAIYNLLALIEN